MTTRLDEGWLHISLGSLAAALGLAVIAAAELIRRGEKAACAFVDLDSDN